MELEEINTSIRKPNNNFAEEIFENQNYQIEFLREKIKLLDTTQYKIEGTSLEIINQIYQKPELLKNIIRMISEELKKDYLERIPFLYLMSDIFNRWKNDFDLKKTSIKLPEEIFKEIIDILQFISRSIDSRTQNEIENILNIWEGKKIYSNKEIKIIKFCISLVLEPQFSMNEDENKILFDLISTNIYNIDKEIINYSNEMDAINSGNNDNIGQHKYNFLKMSRDFISNQMNIFNTYLKYINIIDSILDKIDNFKKNNNNKRFNNFNNNFNNNLNNNFNNNLNNNFNNNFNNNLNNNLNNNF